MGSCWWAMGTCLFGDVRRWWALVYGGMLEGGEHLSTYIDAEIYRSHIKT